VISAASDNLAPAPRDYLFDKPYDRGREGMNRPNDSGWTSDGDTERVLRDAFAARASGAIDDRWPVPAMSASPGHRRSRRGWALPLAAAAAVAAVAVSVTFAAHGTSTAGTGTLAAPLGASSSTGPGLGPASTPVGTTTPPAASTRSATASRRSGRPAKVVTVSSDIGDGATVGVGEPIVLNFAPAPSDSAAFTKAVTVTVNGQPADGAWYWERPYAGEPIQAHYREQRYWPADATIRVSLPIKGLSAGRGKIYSGALSSISFSTGDAHISTVDAASLSMQVRDNGRLVKTIPVSLGAAQTPTFNGVKIVMQKGEDLPDSSSLRPDGAVRMIGPGYDEIVDWSVRVTADGEYVHAAPWNSQIGRQSTSNGCTNLSTADAKWFYGFSQLGDVVRYVGTDGKAMNPLDGLGDWNIVWARWSAGGLLLNH
jgi:lipoprotein-anchoring transpeptidase ErfK/SrfK